MPTLIRKATSSLESFVFAFFYRLGVTIGDVTIKRDPVIPHEDYDIPEQKTQRGSI